MVYPCMEINLSKIRHNTKVVSNCCEENGVGISVVSKVFCAEIPIVKAILDSGIEYIADSRMENLEKIHGLNCKKILLRIPMQSQVERIVKYADISLNSEVETIKKLSEEAKRQDKTHGIILMIDLGDLREGVLEKDVLNTVEKIINLSSIKLYGIGTNLTCYGGVIPDESNLGRLTSLKDKIEERFGLKLDIISGGNSSSLYLVLANRMVKGINQLRIGESILLGRETAYGEDVPNCYKDCFTLKGEIVELKEKPSIPTGNIGMDAFGQKPHFVDRGIVKRAIVAVGKQDIYVGGVIPYDKDIGIIGASSDHLILDVSKCSKEYKVGDILDFNVTYGCLLAAMTSPYIKKYYLEK